MKKWLIALLFFGTPVYASELNNYDEAKAAVNHGKLIRFVIDFPKCISSKATPPKFNLGAFTPNEIVVFSDNRISASLNHFTVADKTGSSPKSEYQFVRYTIGPNSNVNVTAYVLDALTYAPLQEKVSYDCKIGSSAKLYKVG